MILVEVGEPTFRRKMFDLILNEESLSVNLDLVNELRERARFEKQHASFGRRDATTQRSDRGAFRRETSSGG